MALTTKQYALIRAIALREGNVSELAKRFGMLPDVIRQFASVQRPLIETYARDHAASPQAAATVTPTQLDDLWITKKFERLQRYQVLADALYDDAVHGSLSGADLATTVREFRSYLALAANELGQLLHRGSGDSGTDSVLSVEIAGVDMEALR